MATTTPNYGWTVPTSTDLVKDGATAIETLGDAIDASMNTALGTKKAGMVLLNTTSFSGVTTQSVNTVFSSTYDNYRILIQLTAAAGGTQDLVMRMRAAGSDTSGSNYRTQRTRSTTTTVSGISNVSGTDDWFIGNTVTGDPESTIIAIDLMSPNIAKNTKFLAQAGLYATNGFVDNIWGILFDSTQYDGFTIIALGNVTGTLSVYGYNK
jgi:hypothetical protein